MHEHIFAKYDCCDPSDWGNSDPTDHGLILAHWPSMSTAAYDSVSDTQEKESIRKSMYHCSMPRMLWHIELEEINPDDIQGTQTPIVFVRDERSDPMSMRSSNPIVGSGAIRFFADSRKFLSTIMLILMPDCGEDTS